MSLIGIIKNNKDSKDASKGLILSFEKGDYNEKSGKDYNF